MAARDYKETLLLPKTSFPMKGDLPKREPERLARWMSEDLYGKVQAARAGSPRFVLHDGPPYANGRVHIGTAMNKILKDLVVRSKTLAGFQSPYVPGWDCHGLPIELGVDKELGPRKRELDDVGIRRACRAFAEKWIDLQREDFKRLGILGTWDRPYRTMDFVYQAEIARAFGEFVARGLVTFGFKSVLWCVNCKTALAEAEVEYEEKTDPSIYVAMPVDRDEAARSLWGAERVGEATALYAVIWTTTPWTMPANRAVALGPEVEYVLAERKSAPGTFYLLAEALVPAVGKAVGWDDLAAVAGTRRKGALIAAADLVYRRPFAADPADNFGFLTGEHVSTTDGTGLVHTAPGHGRDDYEVVRRAGLPVDDPSLCPVDPSGFYDANAPEALRGKRVVNAKSPEQDANRAVLEALSAGDPSGALLLWQGKAAHSYPHCWRCKSPVIFRATHQWFIDLGQLRPAALRDIRDRVTWYPAYSANRIGAMVENRLEWTISRQRRWGSPITFLRCTACAEKGRVEHYPPVGDQAELAAFFARVVEVFREHGADAWYDDAGFPAERFLPKGASCPGCSGTAFEKVKDILDVWFDSGVSHAAVLRSGAYGIPDPYSASGKAPVVYLEGHDQHRGWFQSSLLTSVALTGHAPYDAVLTHGFVMDGRGHKMSKSVGNVVAPEDVLKTHGADVLRFFLASSDVTDDVRLNQEILSRSAEAYRKLRNTARFLLSVLFDFDPRKDAAPDARLSPVDLFVLDRASRFVEEAKAAYERYEFHTVARRLLEFATIDLSALWCDVRKDALYVLAADDPARRSAQTAALKLAETIALLLNPISPFTAEEIWENVPGRLGGHPSLETYAALDLPRLSDEASAAWTRLEAVRDQVLKELEPLRRSGAVGTSAQAAVEVPATEELRADMAAVGIDAAALAEFLVVPEVVLAAADALLVVRPAEGTKCPRCWQTRRDGDADGLCGRCQRVLGSEPQGASAASRAV